MSALLSSGWVGCQKEEIKAQVKNHEFTSVESCGFFTSFVSILTDFVGPIQKYSIKR